MKIKSQWRALLQINLHFYLLARLFIDSQLNFSIGSLPKFAHQIEPKMYGTVLNETLNIYMPMEMGITVTDTG
jgi:hypothetical protein